MSDRPNAVISGSLAEIRFVKTRSVCQLVVEIPIEQSEDAIAKFGVPIPGREIPLALALLQVSPGPAPAVDSGPSTAPSFPKDAGVPARDTVKSERAKERYLLADDGEKAVMRAGLLPKDERFRAWTGSANEAEAAQAIRNYCGIKSRRELATNEHAYRTFRDVEFQFHGHAEIRS